MTQNFSNEFTEVVNNIQEITREVRHSNASDVIKKESVNFTNFVCEVYKKSFEVEDGEDYVTSKVLDAMDYLLDTYLVNLNKETYDYRVINSYYDILKEFYFGE